MKKLVLFLAVFMAVALFTACVPAAPAVTPAPSQTAAPAAVSTAAPATEPTPNSLPQNPLIRLSITTSVNDSGLLPVLQDAFEAETSYKLEIISNGTGAAIKLGESGDADVLLVHAKASEEEFISKGFGIERIPFMHNFFVIVGPKDDPAKITGAASAADAFKAIAASQSVFVSRGDDSGTNKAELKIWSAAQIDPAKEKWYVSTGKGMGACLVQAAEMKAYCLTDKATFLAMESKGDLVMLLGETKDMKNVYSMIAVNPAKNPGVNAEGANAFISWMQSDKAKKMIENYGVEKYGEPLFLLGE